MLEKAYYILEKLSEHGFEAYLVGGCVRDQVIGIEPGDYDITTSARPEQVEAIFERTVPTGRDYGTMTVLIEGDAFEVTTYRLESDYDGRRPKVVSFGSTLVEDLARRDFTMNAMAMDRRGVIVDPFNGQDDLRAGRIRFVGVAAERIREDRLRALRYVRFSVRYNLSGDKSCLHGVDLTGLSAERIRDELDKILTSDRASEGIQMLLDTGLIQQFLPEILLMEGFEQHNPNHKEDVLQHTLAVLSATPKELTLRLAALFHDIGKPETFTLDDAGCGHFYGHQKVSERIAVDAMNRLHYSNKQMERVATLVRHHMRMYEHVTEVTAKRLIQAVGQEGLFDLFKLQRADTSVCEGDRRPHLDAIELMEDLCHKVLEQKLPLRVTDLAVNGSDMMALGLQGPQIGCMLKNLLERVVENQIENDKPLLMEWARKNVNSCSGLVVSMGYTELTTTHQN